MKTLAAWFWKLLDRLDCAVTTDEGPSHLTAPVDEFDAAAREWLAAFNARVVQTGKADLAS